MPGLRLPIPLPGLLFPLRAVLTGGRLLLGTPDYALWEWLAIEATYKVVMPASYGDEHITHYTRRQLEDLFQDWGFRLEAVRYIFHGELILAFQKVDGAAPSHGPSHA